MPYTETSVEEFGTYTSRVDELLAYPGDRPDGSFVTTGTRVYEFSGDFEEFRGEADELLDAHGQTPLDGRVPVLSYGANANPPRIRDKLTKYGMTDSELLVPYVSVVIPEAAAVWHGTPGQTGSIFAELYKGEEVADGELRTHLSFMTTGQVAAVHASEGTTYSLVRLEAEAGTEHQAQKALAYVALDGSVLLHNELPVGVAGLSSTSSLEVMTAEGAVDYILAQDGVREIARASSARELIEAGLDMKLSEKKERQARIGEQLAALGVNRPFVYPADKEDFIGRLSYEALTGRTDAPKDFSPETFLTAVQTKAKAAGKDIFKVLRGRADAEQQALARNALDEGGQGV